MSLGFVKNCPCKRKVVFQPGSFRGELLNFGGVVLIGTNEKGEVDYFFFSGLCSRLWKTLSGTKCRIERTCAIQVRKKQHKSEFEINMHKFERMNFFQMAHTHTHTLITLQQIGAQKSQVVVLKKMSRSKIFFHQKISQPNKFRPAYGPFFSSSQHWAPTKRTTAHDRPFNKCRAQNVHGKSNVLAQSPAVIYETL